MTTKPTPPSSEYYDDVRSRLHALVDTCGPWFRPNEVAVLNDLVEANESGVALEMLSEMLPEADAMLDGQTLLELTDLAKQMGLDPAVRERLAKLSRA
jgi:hypothetical protein